MVVDKERLDPNPSGGGSIEGLGSDPGEYGTPEIIKGSIYCSISMYQPRYYRCLVSYSHSTGVLLVEGLPVLVVEYHLYTLMYWMDRCRM